MEKSILNTVENKQQDKKDIEEITNCLKKNHIRQNAWKQRGDVLNSGLGFLLTFCSDFKVI